MTAYISDCGQYLARTRPGFAFPDVFDRNGNVWRGGRYTATGWDDCDPRYVYPEFPRMVTAWANRGRRKRSGEWVVGFALTFGDYDQTKQWRKPGVDARIGPTVKAEFHKVCPPKRPPRWVREILESEEWRKELLP